MNVGYSVAVDTFSTMFKIEYHGEICGDTGMEGREKNLAIPRENRMKR